MSATIEEAHENFLHCQFTVSYPDFSLGQTVYWCSARQNQVYYFLT